MSENKELKDWKILSFCSRDDYKFLLTLNKEERYSYSALPVYSPTLEEALLNTKWMVHTVRRIQDDKEFSIGDEIECTILNETKIFKIAGFKVIEDHLRVQGQLTENNTNFSIDVCK